MTRVPAQRKGTGRFVPVSSFPAKISATLLLYCDDGQVFIFRHFSAMAAVIPAKAGRLVPESTMRFE